MNSTIVVDSSHISPRVLPFMSDSALALVAPLVVYWVYSLFFHFLSKAEIPWVERYRIHDPEDMKRNKVSVKEVIQGVIFQQVLQTVLGIIVLEDESSSSAAFLTTENITSVVSNGLHIMSVKPYIVEQFGMPAYINVLTTISSLLQHYLMPAFQFFIAM
jgi:sphinganine C4-monooxygenase